MNKLYTAQEVADRLRVKKTTVYELIKRGELSSSKIGKQLRISEEQLAEYLKGTVSDSEQRPASPDFRPESSLLKRDYLLNSSGLIISGQAPSVMELLMGQMAAHPLGLPILHSHMNSYNGLYSLYFGKVHAAAAGVFAEDITPLLPGIPLALLTLYEFTLGLYIKEGNPKDISGIQDLTRKDIILANREKGSTSRIYLDKQLKKMQIPASSISGYQKEFVSDFSAVAAVIDRHCDRRKSCRSQRRKAGLYSTSQSSDVSCHGGLFSGFSRISGTHRDHPFRRIQDCTPRSELLLHGSYRRTVLFIKNIYFCT